MAHKVSPSADPCSGSPKQITLHVNLARILCQMFLLTQPSLQGFQQAPGKNWDTTADNCQPLQPLNHQHSFNSLDGMHSEPVASLELVTTFHCSVKNKQ